tara:strand:- start:142 stop:753 length:612 start_codon:yes stop_codon:yes gene_type:complete
MRIGISLNEVLRDNIGQFLYTYEKYIKPDTGYQVSDIKSLDFMKYFDFKTVDELNSFMYDEVSLELCGHNDQMVENLMTKFNMFLMDIKDEEEHEIEIVSREIHRSIPSTLFFLSKLSCRAENIRFVQDHVDYWKGVDVLITADPKALDLKPTGKISVKINTAYNTESSADFELDSILEVINDENLRNNILNTKITTYENIEE